MDKGKFYAGIAVMVGLIVSGVMLPVAVKQFRMADRTVAVKGLCEREVAADKVIWPIMYKTVGNELTQLYTEIESKNKVVEEYLKNGGIPSEEISVSAPKVSDKYTQEYGSNDRTYRYVATSTITVCSKDVDKVLSLINSQNVLIKKGIAPENDWDCKTVFSFESLNEIKPEMIQEATKNAREVALKFAQDSQSKLGKIKSASQGTFTIEDRDASTPHIKKVRVVTGIVYYLNN